MGPEPNVLAAPAPSAAIGRRIAADIVASRTPRPIGRSTGAAIPLRAVKKPVPASHARSPAAGATADRAGPAGIGGKGSAAGQCRIVAVGRATPARARAPGADSDRDVAGDGKIGIPDRPPSASSSARSVASRSSTADQQH